MDESINRPSLLLLCKNQLLPCIAPPEVAEIPGPTEPETTKFSNLGAKKEDLIAKPASCAPCPGSPESVIVRFLNVVDASTKYSRTPTVVESSTVVFSNHAPVALTSIAANPIPAVLAFGPPVPLTTVFVKSAVS